MIEAAALDAAGQVEAALDALGRLPPEAMAPDASLLAAACLLRRPDPLAAIAYLARSAAADGMVRVDALRALARIHTGLGQDGLAIEDGRGILADRPHDAAARFLLGRSLRLMGWPDLAMREFRALPQPLPAWWAAYARETAQELSHIRTEVRRRMAAWRAGRLRDVAGFAKLLIGAGRLRAAEAVLARGKPVRDAIWTGFFLRLRQAQGAPDAALRQALCTPLGLPAASALPAARTLLQIGEVVAAQGMLRRVPKAELGGAGTLLRTRLLVLADDLPRIEALAAAGMAAAPDRTEPARQRLTAMVLSGRLPVWHGADPVAGAPLRVHLVQYWHAPEPPADVAEVLDSWVRHNPDLPIARFHAATAHRFIAEAAGTEAAAAFESCRHPAMQSDLFRLVFLARHGGLWTDADERCTRPLPDLLARLPGRDLVAPYSDEIPYYVHSYLMAAPPGSPLLASMAAEALARLAKAAWHGQVLPIWDGTGPGLLTRMVAGATEPGRIALLCPRYFRSFSEPVEDLAYRRTEEGNWRLA